MRPPMLFRFALLAALLAPAASAQPGTLDPAFGTGGVAASPAGGFFDLARLPDGRLVGVGFGVENDPFVAVFRADGALAAAATPFDPGDDHPMLVDVVALPDGKVLVTGGTPDDDDGSFRSMFVARLTSALTLDPTFGAGGFVYFDGVQAPALTNTLFSGAPLTVGDDGAIYVAGRPADAAIVLAVARLFPDGTPDPDFGPEGTGGLAAVGFVEGEQGAPDPAGIAIDASGRLVVGASLLGSPLGQATAAIARFTPDGQADLSFGGDGAVVVVAPSGFNTVLDLVVTPEGPIVSGYSIEGSEKTVAYALRLLESGAPDPAFGAGGFVFAPGPQGTSITFGGLAVDAAGRVLIGAQAGESEAGDALVFRFLPDGKPDDAFGTSGYLRFRVSGSGGGPFGLVADGNDVFVGGIAVPEDPDANPVGFIARVIGTMGTDAEPDAELALGVGQPYPNPTAGRSTLALPQTGAPVQVEVFDALGRRTLQVESREADVSLDLGTLPAGAYVVRVRAGDEVVTRRLVRL